MKICFICNNVSELGGIQRVLSVISNELSNYHKVDILCLGSKKNVEQKNMYKFNNLLSAVAIIKNAIPFTSCHALESFTILNNSYAKNITIVISNITETNFIGYSCHNLIYDIILFS